jgi:nitrile hydratase subunit beta
LNSVHDIGGMDGFGSVPRETDEPVFHEPWESRVFGMSMVRAGLPPTTLDAGRHQLERLEPVQYLSSSYYERWLARINAALVEAGILSREEIDRRMQEIAADPGFSIPHREDPVLAETIVNRVRNGRPASRKIRQKPRFAVGDRIVTRNLNPHGHTRLPRYARGRRGVIIAHHGAHVFPDSNAHGLGENPQHLYTVRIPMRELWGSSAEGNGSVLIDLWESYLEKADALGKSGKPRSAPAAKKIATKTLPSPAGRKRRAAAEASAGSARRGRVTAKRMRRSR